MRKSKRLAPGDMTTWFDHISMDSRWRHGMLLWSKKLPINVYCPLCLIKTCRTMHVLLEAGGAGLTTVCENMLVMSACGGRQ